MLLLDIGFFHACYQLNLKSILYKHLCLSTYTRFVGALLHLKDVRGQQRKIPVSMLHHSCRKINSRFDVICRIRRKRFLCSASTAPLPRYSTMIKASANAGDVRSAEETAYRARGGISVEPSHRWHDSLRTVGTVGDWGNREKFGRRDRLCCDWDTHLPFYWIFWV